MNAFFGNSLWQLVVQSDAISKFVLLVLLVLSIACWTVFFYKLILIKVKKMHMRRALDRIKSVQTYDELLNVSSYLADTVPGYFLAKNMTFIKSLVEANKVANNNRLSMEDLDLVQQHMHQTIDGMVYNDEAYLALLSTSAAVSPLLGLFGTVWGLVHSFIRISERQSADITTVAPGIAEALITTLAGLMVAIPALIMFNYLQVQIRKLEQYYIMFADKVGYIVQFVFVK